MYTSIYRISYHAHNDNPLVLTERISDFLEHLQRFGIIIGLYLQRFFCDGMIGFFLCVIA